MTKKKTKAVAEKQKAPMADVAKASVQTKVTTGGSTILLFQLALQADEVPKWWTERRDSWLRSFWKTAPFLPGLIYSISARNAAFRFEFTGPEEQVDYAKSLFAQADLGTGWQSFIMKVTQDLLTQDNGAFIEVIRPARVRTEKGLLPAVKALDEDGEMAWFAIWKGKRVPIKEEQYKIEDDPLDLPLGIAHLDAGRCTRTGDIDFPVKYTDTKNHAHKLSWWQVITLEDMPSPQEDMNGVGFCAVSRILRAAQILRDIAVYKAEKVGGRFAGRVYITTADVDAISDAVLQAKQRGDQQYLSRYMPPIIAQAIHPDKPISVESIDLASLPENFDEEQSLIWYITELALGAGVDYTYLAPLPGSGLGTASQVETMARQTKGKSSRLFMEMFEFKARYHAILPKDVEMKFIETDAEEEETRDTAAQRRAETRSIRIKSKEITPEIARQIAVDQGDLEPEYMETMGEVDITPEVTEEATEDGSVVGDVTEEPEEKARHRRDKCMNCSKAPTIEVLWAEGMAYAWFCGKCYKAWLKESDMHEVNAEKKVLHGIARKKWSDRVSPKALDEKGILARLKAIGDRLRLRRRGEGYVKKVNDYAKTLIVAYDEWAEKWAPRLAGATLAERDPLIAQATREMDEMMQEIAVEGLPEAYALGLDREEMTQSGLEAVDAYTDRNRGFLEYSFDPAVQEKLKAMDEEAFKDAGAVLGTLGTFRGRAAMYAGPYWVLIWKGMEEKVAEKEQAETRQIPVARHLDPVAGHCATCPPKAGGYKSWGEMVASTGGVPADGSDDCGCNCRCWLELGG